MNPVKYILLALILFINLPTLSVNSSPGKPAEAIKLLLKKAQKGDANAQFKVGIMYHEGEGVEQNYQKALKWLKLSAEQKYPEAQFKLGQIHRKGRGVPRDYKQALEWYELAANQGHPKAQFNLGVMYDQEQGLPHNIVGAHKWYSLAGEQGLRLATRNRDLIAKHMTPEQINKSKQLIKEWKKSQGK